MKSLYLEPSEEITSVIDKLSAVSDHTIAIVVPKNSTLFQSLVNLKLLAKEAKKLGKEVVVVANSKVGSRLAEQVGLKSYANLGALGTQDDSPKSKPEQPAPHQSETLPDGTPINQYRPDLPQQEAASEPEIDRSAAKPPIIEPVVLPGIPDDKAVAAEAASSEAVTEPLNAGVEAAASEPIKTDEPLEPVKVHHETELPAIAGRGFLRPAGPRQPIKIPWRSVVISVIILVALLILATLLLPRATVTVSFAVQPTTQTVPVVAKVSPDNDTTAIAGTYLNVDKTGTASVKATGQKDIGSKATGTVTITNKYKDASGAGKDQSYAAGTVLTDTKTKQTFILDAAITVGKVTYNSGNGQPIYQSQNATVTAQNSGDAGNVAPTTFSAPNTLDGVTITSSAAFSGGQSKVVTVLSQSDIDSATSQLKSQLTADGTTELKAKADKQDIVDSAIATDVTASSVDQAVNAQVDSATATVSLTVWTIGFDQAAADQKLTDVLSANLPDGHQLIIPDSKPIDISAQSAHDKNSLQLTVAGTGYIVPKIDKAAVAKMLAGELKKDVAGDVEQQYGAAKVDVSLKPSWWLDRLPFFSRFITVNYGFDETTQ